MSDFSDLLSKIIKEKDVRVYTMANFCGMDRSAMYKIINGKRNPPSLEIRDKMADFMHLTPAETKEFYKAYEISVIGRETFFRRKAAEHFLLHFPLASNTLNASLPAPSEPAAPPAGSASVSASGCVPLSGLEQFHYYMQEIIREQVASGAGRLGLFIQPDCRFLFDYLTTLELSGCALKVEHILCLNKAEYSVGIDGNTVLESLSVLLPLFVHGLHYEPFYFYDDMYSHFHNMNLFSSMILTQSAALVCTSDYTAGILHRDPATVSLLWDLFNSYQKSCRPLFHIPRSTIEECAMVTEVITRAPNYFIFEPEPCMIPFLDLSIPEWILPPDVPNRENLVSYLKQYLQTARDFLTGRDNKVYYRREDLDAFAETGILTELPDDMVSLIRLTIKERIRILETMSSHYGTVHYRILKPPFDRAARNLRVCGSKLCMYFQFADIQGRRIYLFSQEPELTLAISDYLDSMDDTQLYTEEETVDYLRQVIARLKEKLRKQ